MHNLGAVDRLAWGERVAHNLFDLVPRGGSVVFLAGRIYRDQVIASPHFTGWHASAPMEGLGIGEQKAWLARNARQPALI